MSLVRDYVAGGASSGVSVTLTVPATVQADDTLVAVITGSWVGASITGGGTKSGWSVVVADGGANLGGGMWVATATAGSAGTTVTLSMSNAGLLAASLLVLTIPQGALTRYQRVQYSAVTSPQAISLNGVTYASTAMVTMGGCAGAGTFSVSAGTLVGQASSPGGSGASTFAAEAEPGAGTGFALNVSRTSVTPGQWYVLAQIDLPGVVFTGALDPETTLAASPQPAIASLLLKGRSTKYNDSLAGG